MDLGLHVNVTRLGTERDALLAPLAFAVSPGAVCTLMGPSGVGKSSLLAAIAGTLSVVSEGLRPLVFEGTITLNGRRVEALPAYQRGIGLVTQEPLLFPHLTVAENLAFGIAQSSGKAKRAALVAQALQAADLQGYGDADPSRLSGGQRARVALMRALLAEPRALLLDEPFSKLDETLRQHIRDWFFAQVLSRQIPAVLVTHDPLDIADREHLIDLAHAG
jgi:putative thiamine transport system ATP-binding protein